MGAALDANIVHKVLFFIAPKLIGGAGSPVAVGGMGAKRLDDARWVRDVSVRRLGDDILVEGYLAG